MFGLFILLAVFCLTGAACVSGYMSRVSRADGGLVSIRNLEGQLAHEARERDTRDMYARAALIFGLIAFALTVVGVIANPYVRVWTSGMEGRAQMAQAEANRQIKVREAQSTRDAAILLAEAEVARAKGVAEANRIVADGLGGPEGYLRYLYIEGLKEAREKAGAQVIYVPTEAGLPIFEANRLSRSAR